MTTREPPRRKKEEGRKSPLPANPSAVERRAERIVKVIVHFSSKSSWKFQTFLFRLWRALSAVLLFGACGHFKNLGQQLRRCFSPVCM